MAAPLFSSRVRFALWREWCFLIAVTRHRGLSLLFLLVLVLGGAALLRALEPSHDRGFVEAAYVSFSLLFAQSAGSFPNHPAIVALYFLIPIAGLAVILEAIVEVSAMLRDRRAHERAWCLIMAQRMRDHIILVGLGRLGYRTFRLLRSLDRRVVVVESNPANQFLDEVRADGSPLLIGDARRDRLLRDVGVAEAGAIILATSDDLANLEIALDARRINPKIRVVLRMFDQNMADKIAGAFDLQLSMSQAAISAPAFATAAIDPGVVNSMVLDGALVVSVRVNVRRAVYPHSHTVGEFLADTGYAIIERRTSSGQVALFPPPDTRLDSDDTLLVQGPWDRLASLRARTVSPYDAHPGG